MELALALELTLMHPSFPWIMARLLSRFSEVTSMVAIWLRLKVSSISAATSTLSALTRPLTWMLRGTSRKIHKAS